jgi:nicotinamidase-related amidase
MTTEPVHQKKASALLVIDVEMEQFEKSTPVYQADQLLQNINFLISKAHQEKVPVFFVQHSADTYLKYGSDGWQLHPQMHPMAGDPIVHKRHGNSFEDTNLQDELTKRNVSEVVVTGLVTHGCVKATCLGALEEGYKVVLVSDAHSNFSKDAPEIIEKWNRELGNKGAVVAETKSVTFHGD